MAKWESLCSMVFGAILGNLSARPTENAVNWVYERYCHGEELLNQGKALRLQAIQEGAPSKHVTSNNVLELSETCGNAEAKAHIGMAYCYGWGVQRNRRIGMQMIRAAVRRDPRLGADMLGNPDVCPE